MIRHSRQLTISKPVDEVFDFIATRNYENHPRWEAEVVEIRPLSPGPIHAGSRAVMVRKDFGKVAETTVEVTQLVPNRLIAFRQLNGPMDFDLSFSFEPEGDATRLRVDVAAQPHGPMRLLSPLFKMRMPRVSARLSSRMQTLVEAEP